MTGERIPLNSNHQIAGTLTCHFDDPLSQTIIETTSPPTRHFYYL